MIIPRVIPILLLKGKGLVKTIRFEDPKYIGDPINAVKIFNEKEVDELIVLDITASRENKSPDIAFITQIVSEAFIPVAYGGGIRSIEEIKTLFKAGIEKISLNTAAIQQPELISKAAQTFGSQSIVVSMDIKTNPQTMRYEVYTQNGKTTTNMGAVEHAQQMEKLGAGELLVNTIDRDGAMEGYDIQLIREIANNVNIPVIANGGAMELEDFAAVVQEGGASAAAAGSFFVFCGSRDAILITYPDRDQLEKLFQTRRN